MGQFPLLVAMQALQAKYRTLKDRQNEALEAAHDCFDELDVAEEKLAKTNAGILQEQEAVGALEDELDAAEMKMEQAGADTDNKRRLQQGKIEKYKAKLGEISADIDDLTAQTEECKLLLTEVGKAQEHGETELTSLQRRSSLLQQDLDGVHSRLDALEGDFSLSEGQGIGKLSDHFDGSNFAMLAAVGLAVSLLAMFAKRSCAHRRQVDMALTGSEIQAGDDDDGEDE